MNIKKQILEIDAQIEKIQEIRQELKIEMAEFDRMLEELGEERED